jgi:hypothetical protein
MVLAVASAAAGTASEKVPVPGSQQTFDSVITSRIAERSVPLVLTGTALREHLFINVYSIGSYVQQGTAVRSAEELARADVPKELHLVMERNVSGADMAAAVEKSIVANHAPGEFARDLRRFLDFLSSNSVAKGDRVRIAHVPGVGVDVQIQGKRSIAVSNPRLSRAIWDIYFGRYNLGARIKSGLVSRL